MLHSLRVEAQDEYAALRIGIHDLRNALREDLHGVGVEAADG